MKLREWLDMKVDEAAAKHDVDNSTAHVVDINQKMLSDVIFAVQVMDRRIEIIEAKLGFDAFDIPTKATGILPTDSAVGLTHDRLRGRTSPAGGAR